MIIGSTKEDLSLEKRVSLTPETAKNIIGLGLKICIEKDYAKHIGINDREFESHGVEIKNTGSEVLNSCDLLMRVNCPSDDQIKNLKEKTILIGMLNPSKNSKKIQQLLKKKNRRFHIRITTTYYKSSVDGCSIISIKSSRLSICSRLNL